MSVSKYDRTLEFEEVWVTGGDVRELRNALDGFLANEARGDNLENATWRVEHDSTIVLSVPMGSKLSGGRTYG